MRWLDRGPGGLVLTGPAAVAWACGGVAPPVDRTAATDLVWAVFTRRGAALITTNVEADRIRAEYDPGAHGFADLAEVPWYSPDDFVSAAVRLAGAGRQPRQRRPPGLRAGRFGRPDRAPAGTVGRGSAGPR